MTILGRLFNGAARRALDGPLGSLLDMARRRNREALELEPVQALELEPLEEPRPHRGEVAGRKRANDPTRRTAFTIAVIALSAKMAKADGRVTHDEIYAFRQLFRVPDDEVRNVARLFDLARRDVAGYDSYARHIARMFADDPTVLEELLDALFHIAKADGEVTPGELEFLASVSRLFGLDEATFARIREAQLGPDLSDPYTVLGVARDCTAEVLKKARRDLVREVHPDKLLANGLPDEFVALATDMIATINAAYDRIRAERGFV